MSDDADTLEKRVQRIERINRVLLAGLGCTFVVLVLVAAGRSGDPVRAPAFEIIDGNGKVRGELGLRDGNPGLFLKDESGVDRLLAVHEPDGTGLQINDTSGTTRIGVVQFAHGGGGVALHGPDSRGAAVLYFKNEGSLRFFDLEGNVTRQVTASPPTSE